ncbi:uncharacterized protein [Dysidea avara]|uniref:uncharacterized protein n=1 Tax=Dysidea avara TaxID=196820 RepID=UPI0033177F9B
MDQELLLFRKYLQSSQWINPIRLFIGKAYCAQLYDHSFHHIETNRRFYHEYCKLIEELLISFSCNYNVDATKVSQFVDISIEQSQPTARHLIATRSNILFVQFMKSCDVHLKWQSTEVVQLQLNRKKPSDIPTKVKDQMYTDRKMMFEKGEGQLEKQQYVAQNMNLSIKINRRDPRSKHTGSCDQLRQALEASPGVTMAMAYGFVPSHHTTEYIMNKWYKEQRLTQAREHGRHSFEDPIEVATSKSTPLTPSGTLLAQDDRSCSENHSQSQDGGSATIQQYLTQLVREQ